ncbi:hypothetical protein ID866_6095 [Astraeus odoratus]|nr:hypothetical protein ID866_6095 [Astraeus odoratus]
MSLEPGAALSEAHLASGHLPAELTIFNAQEQGSLSPSAIQKVMSLLTPSEALAFQSFLTSLDAADFATDWNMQLDIPHEHMPPAQGREALTKATRDLMSLDADKWRHPLRTSPAASSATLGHRYPQAPNTLSFSLSPRHDRSSSEGKVLGYNQPGSSSSRNQPSASGSRPQQLSHAKPLIYDQRPSPPSCHSPTGPSGSSSSSTPGPSSVKRSPPPDVTGGSKRHRLSNASAPQPSCGEVNTQQGNRTALLSPSQKKANHIQSEQKRRANIRRGYDALCEIVPALREACQAEEERVLAQGKSRGRRRGRSKTANEDGERVDGRAGPRSENVVLSKSGFRSLLFLSTAYVRPYAASAIDYVNELLCERKALMQRLHTARNMLPADHPYLQRHPDAPQPLWERKWTGGSCKEGEDDEDEDDED